MHFFESLQITLNRRVLASWTAIALALFISLSTGLGLSFAMATTAPNPEANPADPEKLLRVAFPAPETGFDPVRVNDLYSNTITAVIFQTLVSYDWMAMPTRIAPNAAQAMPMVSTDEKTYTFKIKKGLFFTPDEAFRGQRRELTAYDFVYTLLRHADPKNRSPQVSDFDDKIFGFAESRKKAIAIGKFDYDQRHPGIYALDRYTLVIHLAQPDRNFLTLLTNPFAGGMAREVVEKYGFEGIMANPIGTGPYILEKWVRGSKIILKANPEYPGFVWDFQPPPNSPVELRIANVMQGRKMPQIGRVEVSIIEEPQSMWLAFSGKEIDVVAVPPSFIEKALTPQNDLLPSWVTQGVSMYRSVEPDIRYQFFNMKDTNIGGYTPEKIALRRAIIMGFDVDEEIRVIRKGQAIKAQQMVSPVVSGHDPNYKSIVKFSPLSANALLDQFAYKKDAKGYRSHPDGKPLVLTIYSSTSSVDRERDELWKKSMDRIGIRLKVKKDKFPEMLKQGKQCAIPSWALGWTRSAEAEFVMKLLYSKTIGQNNYSCFESAEYDAYFEQLKRLPDGPERKRVLHNMYRLMEVNGVLGLSSTGIATRLSHQRLEGYRKHPLILGDWIYYDIQKP